MFLSFIQNFLSRHLFERVAIYVVLSVFCQRFYAEVLLGDAAYYHPQMRQWFFYGFLAFDYLIGIQKVFRMTIKLSAVTFFAFILLFMIFHGTFVGLYYGNKPFTIFNDIVPLLMIALNILRMSSTEENQKKIDIDYLLRACSVLILGSTLISFLFKTAGVIDRATYMLDTIYVSVFFAFMFTNRRIPIFDLVAFVITSGFSFSQTNRTTMLFLMLIIVAYFFKLLFKNYLKGLGALAVICLGLGAGFSMLPEDSPTYRRIVGIKDIDLNKKTGSVGERQAEWDAINDKLFNMGQTAELTGLGMGGTYEVRFTHQWNKDYGHAHYSWAWFKMRFGQIGYVYLTLMILVLAANGYQHLRLGKTHNLSVSFICLFSGLYLLTYVNSIFLMSGIQFLSPYVMGLLQKRTINSGKT